MPRCFVSECGDSFNLFKNYVLHLKLKHSLNQHSNYSCNEFGCNRKWPSLKSFKKHFLREHPYNSTDTEAPNIPTAEVMHGEPISENDLIDDHPDFPNDLNESFNLSNDINFADVLKEQSALFCSKLYSHSTIPRNVCQLVIEYSTELFSTSLSLLHAQIMHCMKKERGPTADDIKNAELLLSSAKTPFKDLETEHKRIKYFKEKNLFIAPIPYTIGVKSATKVVKSKAVKRLGNSECQVVVRKKVRSSKKVTGQHIPLRHTLKAFLEHGSIFKETQEYMESLLNDKMTLENFVQGSEWRNEIKRRRAKGDDRIFWPLVIYNDSYETSNPLGSHVNLNKLSAVYVTIPCLPPIYRGSLNSILLALLFKEKERKIFSNKQVFQPVIDELNYICKNGIKLKIGASEIQIYFIVGLLTGDNLGIHQICGFVECFVANHCCRICKVKKDVMHSMKKEDLSLLRDRKNYDEDVKKKDVSTTGVNEECIWNQIDGWHVTEKVGIDIMHDLLESVAGAHMIFLFNYLIDAKYITYEMLCLKITDFDYGIIDSRNAPPNFSKNFSNNSLHLSASETLVLVKYLPLILGTSVPLENRVWELFLIFREILDLLLAPALQKDSAALLQTKIEEHHDLYLEITNSHLTFKFHNMLHYANFFLRCGPLRHLWAMRFEAKHRVSKTAANAISSRRNIELSLTLKHQLQFCDMLFSNTLFSGLYDCGPTIPLGIKNKFVPPKSGSSLISTLNIKSFLSTNWIKKNGTLYKPSMLLLYDTVGDLPQFASIVEIVLGENETCFFVCQKFETLGFDHHFHAFEVTEMKSSCITLEHSDLQIPMPHTLTPVNTAITVTTSSQICRVKNYVILNHAV